jgi:hypothetical protein
MNGSFKRGTDGMLEGRNRKIKKKRGGEEVVV